MCSREKEGDVLTSNEFERLGFDGFVGVGVWDGAHVVDGSDWCDNCVGNNHSKQ